MESKNRILVTGATGNVGLAVLKYLSREVAQDRILAGVRDVEISTAKFEHAAKHQLVYFDFNNKDSYRSAMEGVDILFLLRPPAIANVEEVFRPLIETASGAGIKKIVFLSVQGVNRSKMIPHNQIERLIIEHNMDYIFLRPAYFMQNLTTTLYKRIKEKREIVLPAGRAVFNWVDVENIGEAAAKVIANFDLYKNRAFELTGYKNATFEELVNIMNEILSSPIRYRSVGAFRFFIEMKKDGLDKSMILVMFMLHFLPRFSKPPEISGFYENITGKKPTTLREFIARERMKLEA